MSVVEFEQIAGRRLEQGPIHGAFSKSGTWFYVYDQKILEVREPHTCGDTAISCFQLADEEDVCYGIYTAARTCLSRLRI